MEKTDKPADFGTLLGSPVIAGVAVDVFSNGNNTAPGTAHARDDLGRYLGLKYQCVEFVRRYIWLKHGINLALRWQAGNADDWVENADLMGLRAIAPENVQPGDIAAFQGGAHGHIAIVSSCADGLFVTGQNLFNDVRDLRIDLDAAIITGKAVLSGRCGSWYNFQTFLRAGDE